MATLTPGESSTSTDWQTTKGTVRERTAFLFNNSLMSDVELVAEDPDGETVRIPVHRLVLAISSPVFYRMFYGMFEKKNEIKITDTDSGTLLEFLRFIYCDKVELTTQNVLDVFRIADKYIVPSLVDECRRFLLANITPENACRVLELAKMFDEFALEQACWREIDQRPSECLLFDRVTNLRHETLVELLERDTVQTEEVHMFEASRRWAEAKCKEEGLEKTGTVLNGILGKALRLIRFPVMSQEEFARSVVPARILTSEKALQVYQFLSKVIRKNEVDFPCEKRKHFESIPRKECIRFATGGSWASSQSTHTVQTFSKVTEALTFETDQVILFSGVRLISGLEPSYSSVKATIWLLSKKRNRPRNKMAAFETSYTSTPILVEFEYPVTLQPSSKYVIQTSIEGLEGTQLHRYERAVQSEVSSAGVTFNFQKSSGTSNLIAQILFRKKSAQ